VVLVAADHHSQDGLASCAPDRPRTRDRTGADGSLTDLGRLTVSQPGSLEVLERFTKVAEFTEKR
jgi:hypothetical protein